MKLSYSVLFRTKQGLNHKIRVEKSFKGSIIDSLARCSVWIIGTEAKIEKSGNSRMRNSLKPKSSRIYQARTSGTLGPRVGSPSFTGNTEQYMVHIIYDILYYIWHIYNIHVEYIISSSRRSASIAAYRMS